MGIHLALPTALWLYYAYPNKDVQLSYANSIGTCEVFMNWLAVWNCNLIVQMGVVNLNIPVQKVLKLPTF